MPALELVAVPHNALNVLVKLSVKTFKETFADQNTAANMEHYVRAKLNPSQLEKEHLNPNSEFYFVYQKKQLIGYLKLNFKDAQSEQVLEGKAFEIERIYLLRQKQRQGLGKQLFQEAINIGKAKGYKKLWLGVWEHNHPALAFYQKLGLRPFSSHTFLLGSDPQTDLLLELTF